MKKIILISGIILAIIAIVLLKGFFNNDEETISSLDYPTKLSNKTETIEVTYISWACACANWLPTEYLSDPNYDTTENSEDCIFLESENKDLIIPEEYLKGGENNRIRLTGGYYEDKGISKDYVKPTSEKPKKAKVFKYSKIEIIKPYTIWDFSKKEASNKIIKKGMRSYFEIND